MDLIFNKLEWIILCIYLLPTSAKSKTIVSNKIDLIKHFVPKNYSFYILGDFNLPHADWTIPSSPFNECHENFLKFDSENFFTKLIDSPTHIF